VVTTERSSKPSEGRFTSSASLKSRRREYIVMACAESRRNYGVDSDQRVLTRAVAGGNRNVPRSGVTWFC
jgi:hypothetical protein